MKSPDHNSAVAIAGVILLLFALPARAQSSACGKCHAAAAQQLAGSLHRKIMQRATPLTVAGDFTKSKIQLGGEAYALARSASAFAITEQYLSGKPWQHRIEYTLGSRRFQHYLTTMPDGSIVVLAPTWDIARKQWVGAPDIHNPEESGPVVVWNQSCYSCHVSGAEKNFDLQKLRYDTKWREFGVSCETCHGPGADHAAKAAKPAANAPARGALKASIVNPRRLDAARSTAVCAQCHSFRDVYQDGFTAGKNYYDFFVPVMQYRLPSSGDAAFWPDGRPRWLANEAVALWQSQCFVKGGATCVTCHSQPHDVDVARSLELRPDHNALCTRCHAVIAARLTAHTHHAAGSAGSSCVECHMPRVVDSLNAAMRDHAISVPVPENTIRHGIPNACNLCHKEKDASWALQQVNAWYGPGKRQKFVERADAFADAQSRDARSVAALQRIAQDASAGPVVRANAVGYLAQFSNDPTAYDAVAKALSDSEPLVRGTAALAVSPRAAQRALIAPALATLLSDPMATVRMNAAIGLAAMDVARELPQEYRAAFGAAEQLYRRRAALNSDDAAQQFAAGKFFFLAGNFDAAVDAFRATLQLNPSMPARYDLGAALAQKGDTAAARPILESIPANSSQYAAAQRLLAALDANANRAASTGAAPASAADTEFREGLTAYQESNYGGALKHFEQALQAEPQAEWATKAKIGRAICLAKLSRAAEAESAIRSLLDNDEARRDLDLRLAFVELLYDTGRTDEALKQVDDVIALEPKAPMPFLWRARVLLQLRRIDEAAKAAEESIRLSPDLAAAHNLLIRIYQMQGRAKEAAEQAEWLRQYQQRTGSH